MGAVHASDTAAARSEEQEGGREGPALRFELQVERVNECGDNPGDLSVCRARMSRQDLRKETKTSCGYDATSRTYLRTKQVPQNLQRLRLSNLLRSIASESENTTSPHACTLNHQHDMRCNTAPVINQTWRITDP